MKWFLMLMIGAIAVTLTGCATNADVSSIPVPMAYAKVWQRKMQAAYHWDALAEYQSGLILRAIKDRNKAIYIDPPTDVTSPCGGDDCSPFAQAYHDMLQSNLVHKGGVVVTDPGSANVRVHYAAQVLEHKDRSYGVWDTGLVGAPPAPQLQNVQTWSYKTVDPSEVIITTQVTEGRLILHSGTDIFYYNQGDTDHYHNPHSVYKNVTIKIVDGSGGIHGGF